jgi:hypothetical protein
MTDKQINKQTNGIWCFILYDNRLKKCRFFFEKSLNLIIFYSSSTELKISKEFHCWLTMNLGFNFPISKNSIKWEAIGQTCKHYSLLDYYLGSWIY